MAKKETNTALIVGAGPAGLTAAYELLTRTNIRPIVFERQNYVGGISATLSYKGNKIDIGGHRFFTKSDRVLNWWLRFLPLEKKYKDTKITYQGKTKLLTNSFKKSSVSEKMLIRTRLSRIYYKNNFYNYPVSLNLKTMQKLGFKTSLNIFSDYAISTIHPISPEKTLEDFFINRFGETLYKTFFKSYTEKVWGIKCTDLPPEWGYQRIKQLSLFKSLLISIKQNLSNNQTDKERFLYPKRGPGQLWEKVAAEIERLGGEINLNSTVVKINLDKNQVTTLSDDNKRKFNGKYIISTMPIKHLCQSIVPEVPAKVKSVSENLSYRAFIVVGLLISKERITTNLKDNWIYIHEPKVQVGRIQVFNNWSPHLVKNDSNYWIGMEYFCDEGDPLWKLDDKKLINLAAREIVKLNLSKNAHDIEGKVVKIPKAYPSYEGSYEHIHRIKNFFSKHPNVFLIGRNGMHKYNNQDHSMLTAMKAVDNIIEGRKSKYNIWNVNTEDEYHEK